MMYILLLKQSPCSSDPCLNQATCVAKYENNDYHCACAVGYTGKHCEIGILHYCQVSYSLLIGYSTFVKIKSLWRDHTNRLLTGSIY